MLCLVSAFLPRQNMRYLSKYSMESSTERHRHCLTNLLTIGQAVLQPAYQAMQFSDHDHLSTHLFEHTRTNMHNIRGKMCMFGQYTELRVVLELVLGCHINLWLHVDRCPAGQDDAISQLRGHPVHHKRCGFHGHRE